MTETSENQSIVSLWVSWHFFEVPRKILKAWKNFLLFNLNYFSVPLLLKTLFSHWRRYVWMYPRGFDFWGYFDTSMSNLISRIMGAFCRIVLIIIGVFAEILICIAGPIVLCVWILLPILLVAGLIRYF